MRVGYKLSLMDTTLKRAIARAGGVRKVAEAVGLTQQAVYHNINGIRRPNKRLLDYIGLRESYVRVNKRGRRTRTSSHSR
jgi:hypothetical protein